METIVLEVPSDVAQKFNKLSASDKNFIQNFIERWILKNNRTEESHAKAVKDFMRTIETIGLKAKERGMTDEIFEQLLKED